LKPVGCGICKLERDEGPTFKITFRDELSGLFHKYYDRVLADAFLSDKDVAILAIYLIEQLNGKAAASNSVCKDLFVSLGRNDPNFKVGTHNARKDSPITQEDSGLYFLRKGLARIRELLGQVKKAPVSVTESGQNLTEIKLFEEFLVKEVDSKDSCCATRMYHRLHYSLF
jgi:hypothetical protein